MSAESKNETMFVGKGIVYDNGKKIYLEITLKILWEFLKTTAKHLINKWISKKDGLEYSSIRLEMFPCKEPTKYQTHWVIIHDPENNKKSTTENGKTNNFQPKKVNEHEDLPF